MLRVGFVHESCDLSFRELTAFTMNVGDLDFNATITVPASTVNVTITSPNPAIALPIGAVGGSLVVNFPISGGNTALVPIHAVGTGTVTL
jgi:hypothetical protein